MATRGWREPTRDIPLRWGFYLERYLAGLGFIMGGLFVLMASNTYTTFFLLLGTVTHVAGWFILPARPARRIWVAWPSLVCVWLLLTGPHVLFALALPLMGWLVVRQRPWFSYFVLLIPIAVGIWFAQLNQGSESEPVAFATASAATIAAAWIARGLAPLRRPRARA